MNRTWRHTVYIAGPYTAPTAEGVEANVRAAIDAGIDVYKRGHYPYIPHLTHWVELRQQERGNGLTYDDYMQLDTAWLLQCNAFLYLCPSPGADKELVTAQSEGLTVFRSVDEIPVVEWPS